MLIASCNSCGIIAGCFVALLAGSVVFHNLKTDATEQLSVYRVCIVQFSKPQYEA